MCLLKHVRTDVISHYRFASLTGLGVDILYESKEILLC